MKREEWASLVEKHPCKVEASPWGDGAMCSQSNALTAQCLGTESIAVSGSAQ